MPSSCREVIGETAISGYVNLNLLKRVSFPIFMYFHSHYTVFMSSRVILMFVQEFCEQQGRGDGPRAAGTHGGVYQEASQAHGQFEPH